MIYWILFLYLSGAWTAWGLCHAALQLRKLSVMPLAIVIVCVFWPLLPVAVLFFPEKDK